VGDECRHLDLGQVIAEVGVGERFYAVECTFRRSELRDLAVVESAGLANQVVPIARGQEVGDKPIEERDTVAAAPSLKLLDRRVVQPALRISSL
jgi:hypothetical protein